jgi:RNA polymerase sigma-70 factor (ECF subfamily)
MPGEHDEGKRLLHQMGSGSAAAFEQFYERYIPLVLQIALRMLDDQMEAEDVCHDVFLEVYRKAEQYDGGRGSVEAWLAVKTRSRCLDRLRRKKHESGRELAESRLQAAASVITEESVLAKLERETVREVMKKIPEAQREAVYGMYFQSFSHQELAKRMERPLGTVKSLIRYGLNNLKKQLTQMGWAERTGEVKERE